MSNKPKDQKNKSVGAKKNKPVGMDKTKNKTTEPKPGKSMGAKKEQLSEPVKTKPADVKQDKPAEPKPESKPTELKRDKPADPGKVVARQEARPETVEPELQDKASANEPVPLQSSAPPMQVHTDIEKTPSQPDPQHPGFVSGGDIIIRLSQVELNQRLNEVGEQTERANEISEQIANAFNAMGEQYEKGWEINRAEADETRDTLTQLTERIAKHEAALDQVVEKMEHQIDRQLESVSGSVSSLDEVNHRQNSLLIRLMILVIILLAVAIGLPFLNL